jgi:hypothetical protein
MPCLLKLPINLQFHTEWSDKNWIYPPAWVKTKARNKKEKHEIVVVRTLDIKQQSLDHIVGEVGTFNFLKNCQTVSPNGCTIFSTFSFYFFTFPLSAYLNSNSSTYLIWSGFLI